MQGGRAESLKRKSRPGQPGLDLERDTEQGDGKFLLSLSLETICSHECVRSSVSVNSAYVSAMIYV